GPLGAFFRKIGGIPVWRSKHTSMTENLAAIAKDSKSFHLCITPEGTRSLNPDWKKGFYVIAQKAELPILLYGVDYEKRIIRCTRSIIPSGDIDKDMRDIKLYYKDFKGKYPEKFTIGEL
ncbi:MAG TPA: acyltransferase, partial [Xylanibacter oryzae]|nr:acyltransferase [Xylanibacter oryzae]